MTAEQFNKQFNPNMDLREAIKSKGVKIKSLAVAMGISPTYLYCMLSGHQGFPLHHKQKIEMILDQIEP